MPWILSQTENEPEVFIPHQMYLYYRNTEHCQALGSLGHGISHFFLWWFWNLFPEMSLSVTDFLYSGKHCIIFALKADIWSDDTWSSPASSVQCIQSISVVIYNRDHHRLDAFLPNELKNGCQRHTLLMHWLCPKSLYHSVLIPQMITS